MWSTVAAASVVVLVITGSSMIRAAFRTEQPYAPITIRSVSARAFLVPPGGVVHIDETVCATERTSVLVSASWRSAVGALSPALASVPAVRQQGCTHVVLPIVAFAPGHWALVVTETPIGEAGPGMPSSAVSPPFTIVAT